MCRLENKVMAPLLPRVWRRGGEEPPPAVRPNLAAVSSTTGAAAADLWIDSIAFTAEAFAAYISLVARTWPLLAMMRNQNWPFFALF
jgi:hypothetical protein